MEKRDKKNGADPPSRSSALLTGLTFRTDHCQECGQFKRGMEFALTSDPQRRVQLCLKHFRMFTSVLQSPIAMCPPARSDQRDPDDQRNEGSGQAQEEHDWKRAWVDHLARTRGDKPRSSPRQSKPNTAPGSIVRLRCPRCQSRLKLERDQADWLCDTARMVCPECHSHLRLGRNSRF